MIDIATNIGCIKRPRPLSYLWRINYVINRRFCFKYVVQSVLHTITEYQICLYKLITY